MKNLALKLLVQLLAIPSIILLFISSYYLYTSYKNYQKAQKLSSNIHINRELNKILVAVEEEKSQSYTYYLSHNQIPLAKLNLQKARTQLNNILLHFRESQLAHNKSVENVIKKLNHITKIRKEIDGFKNDNFEQFYNAISSSIMQYEKRTFRNVKLEDIDLLLNLKITLKDLLNKSFAEKSMVSYYMTQDIPMNASQYGKLKNQIEYNYFQVEIDRSLLSPKTVAFINSKKFRYILHDLYDARKSIDTTILKYLDSGEFYGYTVDNLDWSMINNHYVKSINLIINDLDKSILKKIKKIQTEQTQYLIGAFLFLLLSIFILGINILLVKWTNTRIAKFTKLVKSISDVTQNKKEIKLLTEKDQEEAFDTVNSAIAQVKNDRIEAQSANRAKSLFLANMSHEIRTPLNGVLGFIALLKESRLTAEQNEYLNIVQSSAETLLNVINNILDISKLESGKVEIYNSETNLANVAKTTIKLFKAKANEKNIELSAYIDPKLPLEVMADSLKIKEILSNLIGNALKFTKENGHISIEIRLKEIEHKTATVYFHVQDDGIGIAPEKHAAIFQAFEQAEQSTTKEYGGTGLGVSIIHNYLQLMDSGLQLESSLGNGAKFYFELDFELERYRTRRVNKKYCELNIAFYSPEHTLLNPTIKEYFNFYQVSISKASRISSLQKMVENKTLSAVIVECRFLDEELIDFLNTNDIESLIYSKTADVEYLQQRLTAKAKFLYMPIFICDIEKILASLSGTTIACNQKIVKISDLRVMVVEDDKINQNVIKHMLEKLLVDVKLFQDGQEALKEYALHYNQYDMIFMDLRMPRLNGIEATEFILNFEKKNSIAHTPIIALTADVSKENKEHFLSVGADAFLSKPTKQSSLIETINNIINEGI